MPIPRRRFLGLGAAAAAAALTGCGARVAAGPRPPGVPFEAFDGKIEHFIVLMLENRSYDQMLGALGRGDGYVIARADSESAFGRAVYRQNAGLDANADGIITAGEAASRVSGLRG